MSQAFRWLTCAESTVLVIQHFTKWRAKYGGMDASMIKEIKGLRAENARLKKMYAEEKLKAEIAREAIEKSGKARSTQSHRNPPKGHK